MFKNRKKVVLFSVVKFFFKKTKEPTKDTDIATIPLIIYMCKFYFYKVVDKIFDTLHLTHEKVHKINYFNKNKKTVVKIHFLLGLDAIKTNQLSDATLRFWLVAKFIPLSNALYYHIALLSYLKGDIKKSASYLLKIQNSSIYGTGRVKELIKRIKNTNQDVLQKLNFKL